MTKASGKSSRTEASTFVGTVGSAERLRDDKSAIPPGHSMVEYWACTYAVGEWGEPPRICGHVASQRVTWHGENERHGTVQYCLKHFRMVQAMLQPDDEVEDLSEAVMC